MKENPIDSIEWADAETLHANAYNPNLVYDQELKLLAHSILTDGWYHPLLVTQDNEIIDGYHRWWLARNNPAVRNLTAGRVPVVRMNLSEPERMMLTVRVNRAKGSHIAAKMHELVKSLVTDYGIRPETIAEGIGASKDEVELLLQEDVFQRLDIKAHTYSKAWYPRTSVKAR